jgi:hypothetical protein
MYRRKLPFTLIELSIVFGLLLLLATFGGIRVYEAISAQYFEESVKILNHKIEIAKKVARATKGACSLAFEQAEETIFLTLDGEALPTKEIRSVLKEKTALRGLKSITLDSISPPFTLSFLPSGQCVKEQDVHPPQTLEASGSRADEVHAFDLNTQEEQKENNANFPEEVLQDYA